MVRNIIFSLAAYFIVNFTSLYISIRFYPRDATLFWRFFELNNTTITGIFHMIIVAVLYFLLGTKLILLDKHWKNYLTVSGSLFVGILALPTFYAMILNSSFVWLLFLGQGGNTQFYIIGIIIAPLPSIFIWLGMVYQSWKKKRKAKKLLHNSAIT